MPETGRGVDPPAADPAGQRLHVSGRILPPAEAVEPKPVRPALHEPPGTLERPQQLVEALCRLGGAAWGGLALLSPEGDLEELFVCPGGEEVSQVHAAGTLRSIAASAPTRTSEAGPLLGLTFDGPGRRRAALCLVRAAGGSAWQREEVEAVRSLCGWLRDAEVFEENRLRRQLQTLNQIAQTAAGGLDLQRLLRAALAGLDREMPLYPGAVWLLEQAREDPPPAEHEHDRLPGERLSTLLRRPCFLKPGASESLVLAQLTAGAAGAPLPVGSRVPLHHLPFARCLSAAEPSYFVLSADDAEARPGEAAALGLGSGAARSCLAVPLRANERTVGILHCVCNRAGGFPADFVQLVYLVADLLGPAVSSSQTFERLGSAYEALREAQDRLVHTEKMRALAEMAAGMAHEFNNALCGSLGFIELALQDPSLALPTRKHLEAARTSALDAAHTVRRVQSFARPLSCKGERVPVDVDTLVQESVELIRHKSSSLDRARGGLVAIEAQTGARRPVLGNTTELREVLLNLAFNAVDAMPGGGTLSLRTWTEGRWVCLAVSDTGVGIPEHARARLFEPFFSTKGERGNGLGLSVVFGIIQRHGGLIDVESEVGHGSTFTVRLPVLSSDKALPRSSDSRLGPGGLAGSPRSLRILVVEDEAPVGRFLTVGLTGLGHRPRLATTANEGLEVLADEGPFDLVLTDLGLPGMSGEELARQVARGASPVPVVMLTGWAGQIQAEGRDPEGVARVLSKPVTLATLAATLKDVCPV